MVVFASHLQVWSQEILLASDLWNIGFDRFVLTDDVHKNVVAAMDNRKIFQGNLTVSISYNSYEGSMKVYVGSDEFYRDGLGSHDNWLLKDVLEIAESIVREGLFNSGSILYDIVE